MRLLAVFLAVISSAYAALLGIDMGSEFMKVSIISTGKPVEIVVNIHSSRKTPSAISFHEQVRAFGSDATSHMMKSPGKVFMHMNSLLGAHTKTEDDVWKEFQLPQKYYPYTFATNATRESPLVKYGDQEFAPEELISHIFKYTQTIVENFQGNDAKDVVITVPAYYNLRQRRALLDAAEIAGLKVRSLVHETAAAGAQRGMDFDPDTPTNVLLFNMGARHTEVCVVEFHSRQTGMVKGKKAPVVTVKGCGTNHHLGGHWIDIALADRIIDKFIAKNPKLKHVKESPRALKKALKKAHEVKLVLSANKECHANIESFFEEVDMKLLITRAELEEISAPIFEKIAEPIEAALRRSNVTVADIQGIELVGGGWRVPKIQEVIVDYFKSRDAPQVLGKRLNGEEAFASAAALIAANTTSSIRARKVFFGDVMSRTYQVEIHGATTGDELKAKFPLYQAGSKIGAKKKISLLIDEDLHVKIYEKEKLSCTYSVNVTGAMTEHLKGLGKPKVGLSIVSNNGIVELDHVFATWEEMIMPKEDEPEETDSDKKKDEDKKDADKTEEDKKDEDKKDDEKKEDEKKEDDKKEEEKKEEEKTEEDKKEAEKKKVKKEKKPEKKVHNIPVTFMAAFEMPMPMTKNDKLAAAQKLRAAVEKDTEAHELAEARNKLEAYCYSLKDKFADSEIIEKAADPEVKAELLKLSEEYEEWMYDEGATAVKAEYMERLRSLQSKFMPIQEIAKEIEVRHEVEKKAVSSINKMKEAQKHITEKMDWVPEKKLEDAKAKLDEFSAWWKKRFEQQKKLKDHEVPAFTQAEVDKQIKKVAKIFDKLRKMKKPAPKKEEDKKEEEKKADQKKEEEKKKEMPELDIEVDVTSQEAVEAALKTATAEKEDAILNEDYENATTLKKRVAGLTQILEGLKNVKEEDVTDKKEDPKASAEADKSEL